MTAIHLDADLAEPERRQQLYEGDLFVFSPGLAPWRSSSTREP